MPSDDSTGLEATIAAGSSDGALDATVATQGPATTAKPAALPSVDPASYTRLDEFARGGLGRIVRARDARTGRLVALKEMLPGRSIDAQRFAREALVTANLQHPAIVPVYEVGTWGGGEPFYAMKLVAGRSLDKVIEDATTIDARLALLPRLIVVAEALAYAHGQGVIHRDLKPANVLAGEFGETVLIDWGLARKVGDPEDVPVDDGLAAAAGAADGSTVVGAVVGTPMYMPPEQARGEPLDERADVYSMGAILYHVLAGHAPYGDMKLAGPYDVVARVRAGPPTTLATRAHGTPKDLLAIVEKALARDPRDRYASARQLAEELVRFQAGKLVDAHTYTPRERLVRWLRQNRAPVAVAALALVVIAIGGTFAILNVLHERDRARAKELEAVEAKDEARAQLAEALIQKGVEAERAFRWDHAAAYYAAAAVQDDRDDARWSAAIAESRALAPTLRLATEPKPLHAVAVSRDGATIAAAGDAGVVYRWRIDGTPIDPLTIGPAIHALAFSADGRLAIGDDDGAIHEVDRDGKPVRERAAHTGRVWSLAYAPDGRLVSGGEDGLAKVWTGDAAVTLTGHTQRVYAVAVSPDGKQVGTASDDRTVRIWPIGGGDGRKLVGTYVNGVKTIGFVGEREVVVGGWDASMYHLDAVDPHEIQRIEQPGVINALAISDDRRLVVGAGDDRFVALVDLATHEPVAKLDGGGAPIYGMALTADTLVTASKDGVVRAWDTRGASRLVRSLGHRSVVQSMAISADGTRLFSEALDQTVRAWDLVAGQEVWRWADPGNCDHALALRGDAIVVGCTRSGRVVQLAAADGAVRSALTLDVGVTALDVHGDVIVAGGGGDHALRVVDANTMKVTATLPGHAHQIYGIAFDADGATFASAGLDQTARRWARDASGSWTTTSIDEAQDDDIIRLDVSGDGALIVTNGETPRIRLWFPDDDARSGWLDGHTARIWTTAISPDGTRVASASLDGTVRLWDVASRSELRQWKPVPVGAYGVAWAPDGKRLAGSFDDGTIIVWDADTGAMLNVFGRDAAALSGGGCAGRAHAGLDAETLAIVDRACTLDPAAYLDAVLTHEQLRLDGVDLVDAR